MEFTLRRSPPSEKSTLGNLYLPGGELLCYTLEDCDRFLEKGGVKIPKQTAIPRGRYEMVIAGSPRFGRPVPALLNVPQFTGVEIHPLNTPGETDGCIGPGMRTGIDRIFESWHALGLLLSWIAWAISKNEKLAVNVE